MQVLQEPAPKDEPVGLWRRPGAGGGHGDGGGSGVGAGREGGAGHGVGPAAAVLAQEGLVQAQAPAQHVRWEKNSGGLVYEIESVLDADYEQEMKADMCSSLWEGGGGMLARHVRWERFPLQLAYLVFWYSERN